MRPQPRRTPSGAVVQSGLGPRPEPKAAGLLLRGVVVATYLYDDPQHPAAVIGGGVAPRAVYCDVLTYGNRAELRYIVLPRCLVLQPTGGMQRGRIWRPKPAARSVSDPTNPATPASTPATDMDGDHVLVGFLDDNVLTPIILGGIPHPAADTGHALSEPAGRRMRLLSTDGDPDFVKHHGAFYGIDSTGSYQLDLRYANNGTLQPSGAEAAPVPGTSGHTETRINRGSHASWTWYDSQAQPALDARYDGTQYALSFPNPTVTPVLWAVTAGAAGASQNALALAGAGAQASLTLGSGAVHVAIAEHLQPLWGRLKAYVDAHTHPSATGPTGTPLPVPGPDVTTPAYDPSIQSSHLALPDG